MNELFQTPTQKRLAKAAFAILSVVSIGLSGSVFAAEKVIKNTLFLIIIRKK